MIEIEPGLWGGPNDFAQASALGNAALIARTRAALGNPPTTPTPTTPTPTTPTPTTPTSTTSTSTTPTATAPTSTARTMPTLVELYAGAGNLTRAFLDDGWRVIAIDAIAPARDLAQFSSGTIDQRVGAVADVLASIDGPVDAVVLDPPRAGAADAIEGIVRLSPRTIVYVSCDPATLARDLDRLVASGYRATDAWPLDLMPQTAHVEVVVRLARS